MRFRQQQFIIRRMIAVDLRIRDSLIFDVTGQRVREYLLDLTLN